MATKVVVNVDEFEENAKWLKERPDLEKFLGGSDESPPYSTATYTINGEIPDKASISLIPDFAEDWTVEGGEEADALHVTVKFLGIPDAFSASDRLQIESAVKSCLPTDVIVASVEKQDTLGPNDAKVLVLHADRLTVFRDKLISALSATSADIPSDRYPVFLPHMTISYADTDLEEFVGDHVIYSRVRVSWGQTYRDFEFG